MYGGYRDPATQAYARTLESAQFYEEPRESIFARVGRYNREAGQAIAGSVAGQATANAVSDYDLIANVYNRLPAPGALPRQSLKERQLTAQAGEEFGEEYLGPLFEPATLATLPLAVPASGSLASRLLIAEALNVAPDLLAGRTDKGTLAIDAVLGALPIAPDIVSAAKKGTPKAIAAIKRVADSPEGTRVLERFRSAGRALHSEAGFAKIPGGGDDVLKKLPATDAAYFEQAAPNPNEIVLNTARTRITRRIDELQTYLDEEPLAADAGMLRTVSRPRANVGAARQGGREKATMRQVEQALVDDATYAHLKRDADVKGRRLYAEKPKIGAGWWVDIEDELPGAARTIDAADPDAGSTLDRLRKAKAATQELKQLQRELKGAAEEPDLPAAGEYFRDIYHRLQEDLTTITDPEEAAMVSETWGRYAQAYDDVRVAIAEGKTEMPPSARERLGLTAGGTMASDASAKAAGEAPLPRGDLPSADAGGEGTRGAGPAGLGGAPGQAASQNFPDLVQRYTVEQREAFDRINIDSAQQGRVKGFGSARRAIEKGETEGAKIVARAKGSVRRLLSPYYYVTNANLLADEDLAVQRLAHARQKVQGAIDAEAIAIKMGDRGEGVGAFLSPAEWAERYRGPAPKNPDQANLIGYIGDVIERPNQYRMAESTRDFFHANQRFLSARLRYAKSQGVDINEFQGEFVTHVYKEPRKLPGTSRGGGVGARTPTQKERTIADYWTAAGRADESKRLLPEFTAKPGESQRGVFETLTEVHQGQLQKSIADTELIRQLKASNLRSTEPRRGFRQTAVPGLSGNYFRTDVAAQIDELFAPERGGFERLVLLPSDIAKSMMASLDASPVVGMQGMRRVMENPALGLRDIAKSTQLVLDDNAWRQFMGANADDMAEAAGDGVNFFKDFHVTTESGQKSLLHSIPWAGGKLQALEDHMYGRGVAAYKLSSYREAKAQIEWGQQLPGALSRKVRAQLARGETPGQIAAQHSNNVYGGLERALRGQSQAYANVERFFLFAPDFLRANVGLIANAATKPWSRQGAQGMRFIGSAMLVSALAAELGTYAASGGQKHANLDDPAKADWLAIKTPVGNVNIMGPMRTYFRSAYRAAQDGQRGDWEAALGEAEFLGRTRLGPAPSTTFTQLRNEDVLGRPVRTARPNSVQDIVQRAQSAGIGVLPFSAQQGIEAARKGGGQAPAIAAISLLGFSVMPERITTQLNEAAQKRFGQDYYDLSPGEKAALNDDESVQRALAEKHAETAAKADAGDPVALVQQAEEAASIKYSETLKQIEDLPPDQWRERYAEARADRLAALDTLRRTDARPVQELFAYREGRKPATDRQRVLGEYFDIFDRYQDPKTGRIDPEKRGELNAAMDDFEGRLSRAQQAELQEDLGAKDTPKQAAYREAVNYLADAGYFGIADRGWKAENVQAGFKAAGYDISKFDSLDDFREAYVSYWVKKKPSNITEESARRTIERKFDGIAAVEEFQRRVEVERMKLFRQDPQLLLTATRWGYNTLSKDEQKILDADPSLAGSR